MSATRGRENLVEMLFLKGQEWKAVPPSIRQMTRLQSLDLSDNRLTDLPDWLGELEHLQTLILSGNVGLPTDLIISLIPQLHTLEVRAIGWKQLPTSIYRLASLKSLDISENEIEKLALKWGQWPQLKHLNCSGNALKKLPKTIGQLSQLRALDLAYNQLTQLPDSLGQCQELDHLNVSNNRLRVLPRSLGQLVQLSELIMTKNRLKRLPASVGDCVMLRRLYLSANRLTQIPTTLSRLQWLSELQLSQNKIKRWPAVIQDCPRLVRVDISHNQVVALSDLSACKTLEDLNISNNQLTTINALPPTLKKLQLDRNRLIQMDAVGALQNLSSLSFSSNNISAFPAEFWRFSSLISLEGQRNPVRLAATDLLDCRALERIEGLLSKSKKKHLLTFLQVLRDEGEVGSLATVFYPLYRKEKAAWAALKPEIAWRGVHWKNPYFAHQFRQHFYTKDKGKSRLKKGMRLGVIGKTAYPENELNQRLDAQNLVYYKDDISSATHLILAKPPYPQGLPPTSAHFYSEAQLMRYLDRLEGRSLSAEKSVQKIAQLRQLLLHKSEINCRLAIQLMEGGGVPSSLLAEGLYLYLSQRFPNLMEKLDALFFPYLPAVTQIVIEQGLLSPDNYRSKRDWERALGTKKIKGDRLLQLFEASGS